MSVTLMAGPAALLKLTSRASFSTRSFARTSWRETWTFRRFVPTIGASRTAAWSKSPMPLLTRAARVRL